MMARRGGRYLEPTADAVVVVDAATITTAHTSKSQTNVNNSEDYLPLSRGVHLPNLI